MGISISGENNNDRILASDGVIDQISGFNVVGVITATSFTGDLTGDVTGNLTGNVTGNINNSTLLLQTGGSERIRITGNNEIGIAGANYGSAGQVLTSGGSGNAVTWSTITGTTINSNTNNYLITGTGTANTLQGESLLTFDGNKLLVASNSYNVLELRADENNDGGNDDSIINFTHDGTVRAEIRYDESDSKLEFATSDNGGHLAIDSSGRLLIANISSRAIANVTAKVQLEGTTADGSAISITRNADSAYPPYLNFGKSRATSTGGTTIIQDGDNLGEIRFSGADGNDLTNHAASINADVDGTPSNNVTPGRLIFSTTSSTGSDATERLRIESDGDFRLSSGNAATNYGWIRGWQSSTGDMIIGADQSATGTGTSKSNLIFRSRGSEAMRITSGRQVRIGNANNLALWGQNNRLQVAGTDWNTSGITIACMSNNGSANLVMGNSRASTPGGSGGALVQDSRLGYISFVGDDGTDMNTVGVAIVAELDSAASSNSMPGRLRFYTGGNSNERLRIAADGTLTKYYNGTSTPQFYLGGTSQVNGIAAIGGANSAPLVVGRDSGNAKSIHCSGNIQMADGYGIDFSPDAHNSNMTSELLDDYEEGTWTPSYSRPNMTLTHGYRDGWYTKVGRVVHVVGRLYTTAESGSSSGGPILVTGLPFAVREVRCALSVRPSGWSNDHPSFATFEKDQTFFELLEEVEGNPSGSTDLGGSRFAGGNGNYLWFSGTYFTDT